MAGMVEPTAPKMTSGEKRDQFHRECPIALVVASTPADVEASVATVDPSQLLQRLLECREARQPSRSSSVNFMSTAIAARVRSARAPRAATPLHRREAQ
jgi:hypothetical protein